MNPEDQQQDAESQTLDELYHDLAEVQAHRHQHDQEREDLKRQVIAMEQDLQQQRQAAVAAGERATYEELSQQLAHLTRAWRALNEDPDADPLEQYKPDESEPEDQPQEEQDGNDARVDGDQAGQGDQDDRVEQDDQRGPDRGGPGGGGEGAEADPRAGGADGDDDGPDQG